MVTKTHAVLILGLTLLLAGALAAQQKPEDIPDAPSATRPIPPPEPPSPRQEAEDEIQAECAATRQFRCGGDHRFEGDAPERSGLGE